MRKNINNDNLVVETKYIINGACYLGEGGEFLQNGGILAVKLSIPKSDFLKEDEKISKIIFKNKFKSKWGFIFNVFQLNNINFTDASVLSDLNQMNNEDIIYTKEVEEFEEIYHLNEVVFDLTKLKFKENGNYIETVFAITNNYNNYPLDGGQVLEAYAIDNTRFTIEVVNIESFNNLIPIINNNLKVCLNNGKLHYNNMLYKDSNEIIPLEYGVGYDQKAKKLITNTQLRVEGDLSLLSEDIPKNGVIKVTTYDGYVYEYQIINYDGSKEFYEKENLNQNAIVAYNFKDSSYIYKNDKYILKTKEGQEIIFNNNGYIETIKQKNKSRIIYEYENGKLTKIRSAKESDENNLIYISTATVAYSNGNDTSVNFSDEQRKVVVEDNYSSIIFTTYDEKLLEGGHSELTKLKEEKINFNDEKQIREIINLSLNEKITISYLNNKVDNIKGYLNNTQKVLDISFIYSDITTKVTNNITGECTTYYFDYAGRVKDIILSDTKRVSNIYKELYLIKQNIQGVILEQEILNGSFESDLLNWNHKYGTVTTEDGLIGDKCLKMKDLSKIEQHLHLKDDRTYILRGYIKHPNATNLNSDISIEVVYKTLEEIPVIYESYTEISETREVTNTMEIKVVLDSSKNTWYEFRSNEFTLPKGAYDIDATLTILAEDELYLDDIKLTYENKNDYNLCYINEFDNKNNQIPAQYEIQNLDVSDCIVTESEVDLLPNAIGNKVLMLQGVNQFDTNIKKISKNIQISGKKGDVFSASLYFKSNHPVDIVSRLSIKFDYEIEPTNYDYTSPYVDYYQLISTSAYAKQDYNSITVSFEYCGRQNAKITNFHVYKDKSTKNYNYDENNKIVEIEDKGVSTSIYYNDSGKIEKTLDELGNYNKYSYDEDGKLLSEINLFDKKTEYIYDENGRITSEKITLCNNNTITNQITYNNNSKEFVNEFGHLTRHEYDYLNRLVKEIYPNGLNIFNTYNNKNQLIKILTTLDKEYSNTITYDEKGNIKLISSKNGIKYEYIYNSKGYLDTIKMDDKILKQYIYDDLNRVIKINLPNENYEYSYNDKNQVEEVKHNDIVVIKMNYDANGNLHKLEYVQENKTIYYSYDINNRIVKEADEKDNKYIYEYDKYGNLIKIITCNQDGLQEQRFSYPTDENSKEKYISEYLTKYDEDVITGIDLDKGIFGLAKELTNLTYVFDNTIQTKIMNFSNITTYANYILSTANSKKNNGSYKNKKFNYEEWKEKFKYNKTFTLWVKPMSEISESNILTFRKFDQEKNIIEDVLYLTITNLGKLALKKGTQNILETIKTINLTEWNFVSVRLHERNKDGKVYCTIMLNDEIISSNSSITLVLDEISNVLLGKCIDENGVSLNVDSKPSFRSTPLRVSLFSVGAYEHTDETLTNLYEMGLENFVSDEKTIKYSTNINIDKEITYVDKYDCLGRLTKKEFIVDNINKFSNEYVHNKTRMTRTTNSKGDNSTYTYDTMGNILTKTLNGVITSYTYDLLGRLTSEETNNVKYTYTYHENGNIKSKNKYVNNQIVDSYWYYYALNDRIYQIELNDRIIETIDYENSIYIKNLNSNQFNWEGNKLVGVTTNTGETFTYEYNEEGLRTKKIAEDVVTLYEYRGTNLVREIIRRNNYDMIFEYIYDYNNTLIGVKHDEDIYYYDKDITGNIVGLIDKNGYYVIKYTYDAWGNVLEILELIDCTISRENRFIYKGYYYDVETKLYYCNSRYYSPELCRFISPDSIEYLDPESISGLNLYCYCMNNPISYYDPSGHVAISAGLLIAGFVIGAVAAAMLFTPVGGTIVQVATSAVSYAGMAVASIFNNDIRNDMNAIGWNPFNKDASLVSSSNKVSFYKGVPDFRTSCTSGSFLCILLTKNGFKGTSGHYWSPADILKHEWGHSVQQMTFGPISYLINIGIPSAFIDNSDDAPWEITADLLGGVDRNYNSDDIKQGWNYFWCGRFILPFWWW